MKQLAALIGLGLLTILLGGAACEDTGGSTPPFDTALLTGRGEVGTINLWDSITSDCQRDGIEGRLPSETLVGVTLVRNDCSPRMYFVGTGHDGENGWVSEDFLDPR